MLGGDGKAESLANHLCLDHDHDRYWYLDSNVQSASRCTRMNKGSMQQEPNVISVRLCSGSPRQGPETALAELALLGWILFCDGDTRSMLSRA